MEAMCNKHVHSTVTRPSCFHCLVGVISKQTTVELWISPVYRRLAVLKLSKSTEEPRDVTSCRETARRYSVQKKIVQIEVVMRPRRRSIDHRAFWTGVGANPTRPAHPAGHSTPANPLSLGAYGENRFLAFHVKYQLSCQTFRYERETDGHKGLSSTALV